MRRALPLLLTACVPGPTLPSPSVTEEPATVAAVPVKKRTLEKDETVTTVSGATFTASAGWTVEERPEVITLTAPEGDLRLSYIEVAESDRDKAIAAAWKRVAPEFSLRVADAVETPARDGWDAEHQVVYLTSDMAQRVVVAVARRKGSMWFIALVDGSQAALDRRNAQVYNALSSLQVEGLEKARKSGPCYIRAARPIGGHVSGRGPSWPFHDRHGQ